MFNVLKSAHHFIEKSPALEAVLPKPPRIVSRNPKTLRDKLARSKIRQNDEEERGNFPCGHSNCEICKTLKPGEIKSTVTGEVLRRTFILTVTARVWCIYGLVEYVKNSILVQLLQGSENGLTSIN